MNRTKLILRNLVIIVVLSLFLMLRLGLYLSPLAAHKNSERSIHYGPSRVIHIEDFGDGKYILGKYDKWVSCNTVNRFLYFVWTAGNQPIGFENDTKKAISCTWSASKNNFKVYGILNDKKIKKVEALLSNGELLTTTEFYEELFLITWRSADHENKFIKAVRGYDTQGNLLYHEEY